MRSEGFQRETYCGVFAAADTTKTIRAAPTNGRIVITRFEYIIITAAAQTVDLEDSSGTIETWRIPASLAVGSMHKVGPLDGGCALTYNEACRLAASAAGVEFRYIIELYVETRN